MLHMGTRAAAFTAKVRILEEFHLRILHSIPPVPTGGEVATLFKYFSQTLLIVLKDVPNIPMEMVKSREQDEVRLSLYPRLEYKGLYGILTEYFNVLAQVQGNLHEFGESLLQLLGICVPYFDNEMLDNLPYLVASMTVDLPPSLHQDIINCLCFHVLPFTLNRKGDDGESYASLSVTGVIMLVFQHSESIATHFQLMECLMAIKPSVLKDLLCVVAHGTPRARCSAAKVLFNYWPNFNPSLCDLKAIQDKICVKWPPFVCQRDLCPNAGSAEAAKICYDHCTSITYAAEKPPPLYLCIECANTIHRERPNQMFYDILHPMQNFTTSCENKNCRNKEKTIVSVCFSAECASYNGNRPIRLCKQCHENRHNSRRGQDHIVHRGLYTIWDMERDYRSYAIESIVSLLKQTKPGNNVSEKEYQGYKPPIESEPHLVDNVTLEESQMLGKFGVWLLVSLCPSREDSPPALLGRLAAILIHWFYATAYVSDDQLLNEYEIEKLKTEHACKWLIKLSKTHFRVILACLMPHPPEYAKAGTHWDVLSSKTLYLKEGLHRLFCLIPYEVISIEIWEHVMPRWLEAIVVDVPPREIFELKSLLSKMLDPDMSPLGFDAKKMYRFITIRFKNTSPTVQEQALNWLQVISTLDIVFPLSLLFTTFRNGTKTMKPTEKSKDKKGTKKEKKEMTEQEEPRNSSIAPLGDEFGFTPIWSEDEPPPKPKEKIPDIELDLVCCVLMLDILIKQMELQNAEKHCGISTPLAQDIWNLLNSMLMAQWPHSHTCEDRECPRCESRIMWYQLLLKLVKFINPETIAHPPDTIVEETSEEGQSRKTPPESEKKQESKQDVVINMPIPLLEGHTVGGVLVHMPHIMTATVETVAEQLDLAPSVAAERALPAVARQVTISDADVGNATARVSKLTVVGENDQLVEVSEDSENFWETSQGKFYFVIEELPPHLQLLYSVLDTLPKSKTSQLYYALQSIHILILHGDVLTKASKEHKGFVIWCQENLLIKNLWEFCDSSRSHIAEKAVPILLHCITLPAGAETFWKLVQGDFGHDDWRVRFAAVERVTVIARFMDSTPIQNEFVLQDALANVFCHLISSMDDENVLVAQRATLYLGTVHDNAMKRLVGCLETQFDSMIIDRPVILQALYQLHNCLSDRKILTWEFFLNRFDALFIEAQITLEKTGEISFVRDLRNSNLSSEPFIKKVNRAHEAIARWESANENSDKTLSSSFAPKWPYKRTMSTPAAMGPQPDTKQEKEKVYSRQYSAPILKRKSSRFGLGQFLGSLPTNTSLPDSQIHQLVAGDDSSLAGLTKVLNLEGCDHETVHLLIFLLMQFFSRSDQAFQSEDRTMARIQGIVVRHVFLLLGYSQQENTFYFHPPRVRSSPVFNAFLSNLPQVLDQNHLMGWILASSSMAVLQHCPVGRTGSTSSNSSCSLWLLEPHVRRCWLMSLLVLLYKYNFNNHPQTTQLTSLIRIVLNTLCAQHHVCERVPPPVIVSSSQTRSRDLSQPSLGVDKEEGDKHVTPPVSPMCSIEVEKPRHYSQRSPTGLITTHWEEPEDKADHSSAEVDDQDRETVVTPDSQGRSPVGGKESGEEGTGKKSSLHDKKREESERKCGVKQGVKMMVTSSLFASQPITSSKTAIVASQSRPSTSRQVHTSTSSDRRSSLASAVATAMQPVVATATVVSVPTKQSSNGKSASTSTVSRSVSPSSAAKQFTSEGSPGERSEKTKSLERVKKTGASTRVDWGARSSAPHSPEPQPSTSKGISTPWSTETPGSTERKYSPEDRRVDFESQPYGSPESPLSKMDVMTLGSPVDLDDVESLDEFSYKIPQLEMPPLERLLPIGPFQDVSAVAERIHRSLSARYRSDSPEQSLCEGSRKSEEEKPSKPGKQESLDRPDPRQVRSSSPRRLIKQVALAESPPEDEPHGKGKIEDKERKKGEKPSAKRKKKVGLFSIGSASKTNLTKRPGSWLAAFRQPSKRTTVKDVTEALNVDRCGTQHPLRQADTQLSSQSASNIKQSSFRIGDDCVLQRCPECGVPKEEYSDEELGLCVVILGTFIHREPTLAAPLLPRILTTVSK